MANPDIRTYFRQPYPVATNRWKIIIPISLFVCFFMLVFQPYGLGDTERIGKNFILAGYGLVTFVVLLIDLFLIPKIVGKPFAEARWTILKELVFLLFIILSIGLANLWYTSLFYHTRFSFESFLIFLLFTAAIGIIPITALTLIKHNYLLRHNEKGAKLLTISVEQRKKEVIEPIQSSHQEGILRFVSDNDKEEVSLDVANLLLVDAEGNYITVVYQDGKKICKVLIRNTLAYAQEITAAFTQIVKCHRSFLVNIDRISSVLGNSQGYRLHLEGYEDEIPVSRRHNDALKESLASRD